jgi:uncharacterized SAM-binding protein YcdF (DUF218 family)
VDSELEAIVVLGCRVLSHALSPAAERRIERAAHAWREQPTARILASGGRRWRGVTEADAFARALEARGVPKSTIFRELSSLTTRENAQHCARWLSEQRIGRFGLVTCDWHMPRALALFRRQGLSPLALPAVSPKRTVVRSALVALREHVSFLWAVLAPAKVHGLTRFFR